MGILILEILEHNSIDTQYKLMQALAERGFRCTQATLSRDIRELRLVKRSDDSGVAGYHPAPEGESFSDPEDAPWDKCLISAELAQSLIVVKTLPGAAPSVRMGLESRKPENLVGILAGEDVLFLAMRDLPAARKLCVQLQKLL